MVAGPSASEGVRGPDTVGQLLHNYKVSPRGCVEGFNLFDSKPPPTSNPLGTQPAQGPKWVNVVGGVLLDTLLNVNAANYYSPHLFCMTNKIGPPRKKDFRKKSSRSIMCTQDLYKDITGKSSCN
jgi:hypothetical protein